MTAVEVTLITSHIHLGIPNLSIVPYGSDLPVLERLLDEASRMSARSVVLIDTDSQGREVERSCQNRSVPTIRLDHFTCDHTGESAIEDVIGVDDYITRVNEFYGQFEWFQALDPTEIERSMGKETLGTHLEKYFKNQWQQNFSKVAIAIQVALRLDSLSASAQMRLFDLLQEILRLMPEST